MIPVARARLALVAAIAAVLALSGALAQPAAASTFQAVEGATFSGGVVSAPAGCQSPQASVDWGDNTSPSPGQCSQNSVNTGSHTYEEEGDYSAVASYTSSNGPRTSSFTVHVADSALAATGTTFTGTAGSPLTAVVAHLSDGDPHGQAADYAKVIVAWGDGLTSGGTLASVATGGFDLTATHTYATLGTYAVDVTVADSGGAPDATAAGTATVASASTTTTLAPPMSTTATPTQPGRASVSVVQLPGRVRLSADWSEPSDARPNNYAWNLDGHTGAQPSALCGSDASQLTTRLQAGGHTANLRVTDSSGVTTSVTKQFVVSAAPGGGTTAPIVQRGRARKATAPGLRQVFICSPGPNDHPGDVTAQGGPPAGCATEVQFGLADAVGCLNPITTPAEWPLAEQKIIRRLARFGRCLRCGAASRASLPSVSLVSLEQTLMATQDPYFSTQPVRINGIDLYPNNGASILLVPNQNYVISSDATMKLGGVPLKSGLIILYVPQGVGGANKVHIDDYTLSEQAKRIGIGDFPFDGSIGLDFVYHRAQLPVNVTLPNVFTGGSGEPIHGAVTLATDNSQGLFLDAVHVDVPQAFLGVLEVDDLFFDYQRQGNIWTGGADFVFPGLSLKLHARPPPPDNGFGLKGGSFDHAGATLFFTAPAYPTGLETFPGLFLKHIGFAIGLNPTRFSGNVGLNVVGLADIDGALSLVFASQDASYVFPTDAGAGLGPIAGRRVTTPSLAVGGDVSIDVPVLGSVGPLGEAYLLYEFPDYVELGAKFGYNLAGVFSIDGHINGFIQASKRNFNLEGGVQACVKYLGCTGVTGLVSSNGIAACWSQSVLIGHISVGVGYHWGDSFPDIYLWGCDVTPYRAVASAVPGPGPQSFALPAGLPFAMVRMRGTTDAPKVTLAGPNGERLTTPNGTNTSFDPRFALLRQPETKTTYIGINHPAAGNWTVTTQDGSVPITELSSAAGLAPTEIRARVLPSGAARILVYQVKPEPGQDISFVEHGPATWRVIGHATGPSGRVRFTPGTGPAGARKIVAVVSHNGIVTKQLEVGSFRAAAAPRPARPAGVRVARHGQNLSINWARTSHAFRYAVNLTLSDGRRLLFLSPAGKRTVLVPAVGPTVSGSVRVAGLTETNAVGRSTTVRFKRLRRPRPARLPRLRA
jgi:hypothetical protein